MLFSRLKQAIRNAIESWGRLANQDVPSFDITIPPSEKLGDYATNSAILLAKRLGENPEKVAEELVPFIEKEGLTERIEVAKGGFINFFLNSSVLEDVIKEILDNEGYGFPNIGKGAKIQIEFVSANPTGPLSVAHGRGV